MAYPTDLDSFPDPQGSDATTSPSHSSLHRDINAAVEGIEVKVGTSAQTGTNKGIIYYNSSVSRFAQSTDLAWNETSKQLELGSTAKLLFGSDVNLYRSAADTLRTDDSLTVGGSLTVGARSVFPVFGSNDITSQTELTTSYTTLCSVALTVPSGATAVAIAQLHIQGFDGSEGDFRLTVNGVAQTGTPVFQPDNTADVELTGMGIWTSTTSGSVTYALQGRRTSGTSIQARVNTRLVVWAV